MPAYQIPQSSTSRPLTFLLVSSTDHIAGLTGATVTVTLSKNGGTYASPAGAVTEVGNGVYKVAGNATDSGTLGPLWLHATATGADPSDTLYEVVIDDNQVTLLDRTRTGHTTTNTVGEAINAIMSAATTTDVVTAILDAALSGHTTTGTVGAALSSGAGAPSTAAITTAILDAALAGHTTAGTVGAALSSGAGAPSAATIATTILAANLGFAGSTDKTVKDALQAAWSAGLGKETTATTAYTKYAPDNTTVLKTFTLTLNGSGDPTARA